MFNVVKLLYCNILFKFINIFINVVLDKIMKKKKMAGMGKKVADP